MVKIEPTIFVVDDDEAVGRAIVSAGKVMNCPVRSFATAQEFLNSYANEPGCLVLDVRLPGMSGLELQKLLSDEGRAIPIVMISGHATVRIAVEAMRLGAMTMLEKPFGLEELISSIRKAFAQDEQIRSELAQQSEVQQKLAELTDKEREVLALIAAGKTNREMADTLTLSVRAIEDRRSRVMKKLGVNSVAELLTTYSSLASKLPS
jgi:FixJ family two-component response regulator